MAIGTELDFVIRHPQFLGAFVGRIQRELEIFNAASGNTIRLTNRLMKGHFEEEDFIPFLSAVSRRDTESTADVVPVSLGMDTFIGVKRNWKFGPVEDTLDAWKKVGESPEELSVWAGEAAAEQVREQMVESAITALVTAIKTEADAVTTKAETVRHSHFIEAVRAFGDKAGRIRAWLMHSATFNELMIQGLTDKIVNIADQPIRLGTIPVIGKPVIITDSPALIVEGVDPAPDTYTVIGLVNDAVEIATSEEPSAIAERVGGKENITQRIQSEGAYNVRVRGFSWIDTLPASKNPTDAALATPANWVKKVASTKELAGAALVVDGAA